MPEPWPLLNRALRGDYRVFTVHEETSRAPATGASHHFYVIDSPDWVNVVPVTPDGHLVFVRQYRHGTKEVTLEIPGGMVDPGDDGPAAAGLRELREETGYTSDRVVDLGVVEPNPAIQSNRCYTVLAADAYRAGPPQPDGTEDLDVVLIDPATVPQRIRSGDITHALVVAAFYLYDAWRHA
ncbi:MAG: NUDIX domain-containing protein [Bacteroidetes bacterium]|jgi:8-oxo-dGTP pyrophosphatase MutT (NUDIX family)|nr:NUDIX domain-containing protein [Bacteroidota bacterium]